MGLIVAGLLLLLLLLLLLVVVVVVVVIFASVMRSARADTSVLPAIFPAPGLEIVTRGVEVGVVEEVLLVVVVEAEESVVGIEGLEAVVRGLAGEAASAN